MITAVLMPITSPREDTSGPPELPGLSAASVWITSSIIRPVVARRLRPERGDHARGHRRLEAERIADGDGKMPAAEQLGVTQRRERQAARGVGTQQCEVGVRIDAEQARLAGAAFGVGQADVARATDHVGVGQHQPVGRDHDARTDSAAALVAGVDAHDRGPDRVDDRGHGFRIGVEQDALVRRCGRGLSQARCRVCCRA